MLQNSTTPTIMLQQQQLLYMHIIYNATELNHNNNSATATTTTVYAYNLQCYRTLPHQQLLKQQQLLYMHIIFSTYLDTAVKTKEGIYNFSHTILVATELNSQQYNIINFLNPHINLPQTWIRCNRHCHLITFLQTLHNFCKRQYKCREIETAYKHC